MVTPPRDSTDGDFPGQPVSRLDNSFSEERPGYLLFAWFGFWG